MNYYAGQPDLISAQRILMDIIYLARLGLGAATRFPLFPDFFFPLTGVQR
jgi:hypothetical protein